MDGGPFDGTDLYETVNLVTGNEPKAFNIEL